MITFVIPTTAEHSGIATAEKALDRCAHVASAAVVVVDGANREETYQHSPAITVICLKDLCGSYCARNIGAEKVGTRFIGFLDDGVEIAISTDILLEDEAVVSGEVSFYTLPKNMYELWYSINAFNMARFLRRFGFLPTIFLIVPNELFRRIGGFDEDYLSSGDVEFCERVRRKGQLQLSDDIKVKTSLREKDALFMKIRRQLTGQLYHARRKYRGFRLFLYVAARVAVNLLGVNCWQTLRKVHRHRLGYMMIAYRICILKVALLLQALTRSEKKMLEMMGKANLEEVRFSRLQDAESVN